MKTKLVFLTCSFALLLSCEKKEEAEIYAGQYDDSFIYHEFSPVRELTFTRDEEMEQVMGKDSLDIDTDGNYDLFITLIKPDSFFPFCYIDLKDGVEAVTCRETYGIGHGQYSTAIFVDTLISRAAIHRSMDWSGDKTRINMWHATPGMLAPSYGSWYYTRSIKYIGLKSKAGKFGWIEIDATDPYNFKIRRFAIEK
jgi:hypothetical protein